MDDHGDAEGDIGDDDGAASYILGEGELEEMLAEVLVEADELLSSASPVQGADGADEGIDLDKGTVDKLESGSGAASASLMAKAERKLEKRIVLDPSVEGLVLDDMYEETVLHTLAFDKIDEEVGMKALECLSNMPTNCVLTFPLPHRAFGPACLRTGSDIPID